MATPQLQICQRLTNRPPPKLIPCRSGTRNIHWEKPTRAAGCRCNDDVANLAADNAWSSKSPRSADRPFPLRLRNGRIFLWLAQAELQNNILVFGYFFKSWFLLHQHRQLTFVLACCHTLFPIEKEEFFSVSSPMIQLKPHGVTRYGNPINGT